MSICKCGSRALNDDPERILCDCCWRDAEIDRLRAALDEVQTARRRGDEIVAGYEIEIQRLRAIVDKLPTTADGVTVVPGIDYVWIVRNGEALRGLVLTCFHDDWYADLRWQTENGGWCGAPSVSECYSTREAAEKASHGTTE